MLFVFIDPELEIRNGGEEVLASQFVNTEESEDLSDPLLITKSFEWKDISAGSVIWGKTSRDIWWPAKVIYFLLIHSYLFYISFKNYGTVFNSKWFV